MRYSLPFGLLLIASFVLVSCFGPQPPAPATHYGTQKGAGSAGIHTISEGETLWNISQRYKIAMRDISETNGLRAPFILKTGQRLRLPPPREYRVHEGDTLYAVSRLFGVSSSELASLNHLQAPYRIQTGDILRLPSVTYKSEKSVELADNNKGSVVMPGHKPEKQTTQKSTVSSKKIEPHTKITAKTPKRASSSGKFLKPVEGPVLSGYGPKKDGLHNDGINIKAPKGTPIHAAENGVVVYAGNELKGSGNLVLLRHEDRWMTAYAHMDRTLIKRGSVVKRGQTIGTVGSTGSVDSPQLHFEIRRGTEAINPARYLGG